MALDAWRKGEKEGRKEGGREEKREGEEERRDRPGAVLWSRTVESRLAYKEFGLDSVCSRESLKASE